MASVAVLNIEDRTRWGRFRIIQGAYIAKGRGAWKLAFETKRCGKKSSLELFFKCLNIVVDAE